MKNKNIEIEKFLNDEGLPYNILSYGVIVAINGVKVEWNTKLNRLIVGYSNTTDDIKKLKSLIIEHFGKESIIGKPQAFVGFCRNAEVENFKNLVKLIQNISFVIEEPFLGQRGKVAFNRDSIFIKMSKIIRQGVNDGMPSLLSRGPLAMDSIDDIITIGESINRTPENSYREHIVPCDFIIRECVEMIKNDKSNVEISMMIKNLLSIVLITPEEASKLNTEMGLIVDMPAGWTINDSPLARLEKAGIKLK